MNVSSIIIKPEYEHLVAPLHEDDFEVLKSSIIERGISEPVVINADNVLLDGHHRVKIAKQLGIDDIPVRIQEFKDVFDEKLYVIEANVARRHLTPGQKAFYGVEIKKIEAERAAERRSAGGVVPAEGSSGDIAAKAVGSSRRSIYTAEKLEKLADELDRPDLVADVRSGKASLDGVAKKAKKLKEMQELEALKISRKARADEDRAEAARAKLRVEQKENQPIIEEINNRGAIKHSIENEDGEMIMVGGDDDGSLKKGSMPTYRQDQDTIIDMIVSKDMHEEVLREVDDDSDVIFNIGYQGKSISEFIEILLDNNIDALVDVRDSPRAMLNEAFNGSELEKHLKDVGIKYIGASEVGAAPEIRGPFQAGDVDFNAFNQYYRASINGKKSKGKLHQFAKKILPEGRVVLMCMESSPAECHRGILCKMLKDEKFYLRIKVL